MKKTVKVVMLPTENKSHLHKVDAVGGDLISFIDEAESTRFRQPQHLYLTSDEEIKEGDWYLFFDESGKSLHRPLQATVNGGSLGSGKKIIATTDKSLTIDKLVNRGQTGFYKQSKSLPQIPQSFVEAYVKAEGKIDEVMVEYEEEASYAYSGDTKYVIKTREDNTVIIHNPFYIN